MKTRDEFYAKSKVYKVYLAKAFCRMWDCFNCVSDPYNTLCAYDKSIDKCGKLDEVPEELRAVASLYSFEIFKDCKDYKNIC